MKFAVETNGLITVSPESGDKFTKPATAYPETRDYNGEPAVHFGTNYVGKKKINLVIRVGGRPELEEAVREGQAIIQEKREQEKATRERGVSEWLATCPDGFEPCTRNWSNGDLCSAEYQSSDGTKIIDSDLIDGKFGIHFIESAKIERERKIQAENRQVMEDQKSARAAERSAKFAESKESGQPVLLRRWTETRRAKEGGEWGDYTFVCSLLAMPDGTTRETATNTY